MLVTSAVTRTPSSFFREIRDHRIDLLPGVGCERFEADDGLVRQHLLQARHGLARRGAQQAERRLSQKLGSQSLRHVDRA
jgi:hypothetical protein